MIVPLKIETEIRDRNGTEQETPWNHPKIETNSKSEKRDEKKRDEKLRNRHTGETREKCSDILRDYFARHKNKNATTFCDNFKTRIPTRLL